VRIIIGALRLLADSFEPQELSRKGVGLYYEFRPQAMGWGEKSEVKLAHVLSLRRFLTHKYASASASGGGVGVGRSTSSPAAAGEDEDVVVGDEEVEGGVLVRPPALGEADEEADVPDKGDGERQAKRRRTEEDRDGEDGEEDEFDRALDDDFDLTELG
jgi:hypothetical protein